jgi:hypothetical protein
MLMKTTISNRRDFPVLAALVQWVLLLVVVPWGYAMGMWGLLVLWYGEWLAPWRVMMRVETMLWWVGIWAAMVGLLWWLRRLREGRCGAAGWLRFWLLCALVNGMAVGSYILSMATVNANGWSVRYMELHRLVVALPLLAMLLALVGGVMAVRRIWRGWKGAGRDGVLGRGRPSLKAGHGHPEQNQPSPDFSLFCCGLPPFLRLCGVASLCKSRYRGGALQEPGIGGVRLDFDGGQCVLTQPTVKIRTFVDACGTLRAVQLELSVCRSGGLRPAALRLSLLGSRYASRRKL